MKYAPIIIPTCNRKEHLQRCIDSLRNNALAEYTDIYISVDYPPSAKYISGYQDVLDYLKKNDGGFKSFNVFVQNHNLGPIYNASFLRGKISNYETWIFTEDDNEFSPNFLEYMNTCLEKYENDETVFTICGYPDRRLDKNYSSTIYLSKYFQPYGFGTWRKKWLSFIEEKEKIILNKRVSGIFFQKKIYDSNPLFFRLYVNEILCNHSYVFWNEDGSLTSADLVIQLYLYYLGFTSVFPIIPKSKTHGNDGSGFTMKRDESYNADDILLDRNNEFLLSMEKHMPDLPSEYLSKKYRIKLWIKYLLCLILRKNRKWIHKK